MTRQSGKRPNFSWRVPPFQAGVRQPQRPEWRATAHVWQSQPTKEWGVDEEIAPGNMGYEERDDPLREGRPYTSRD